jgi:ABC-2 type transport system permease protein
MFNRNIRAIARHEYVTNVRRKEFILMTLGLPVLMLALMGISVLGTVSAAGAFMQNKTQRVGVVDPGHCLQLVGLNTSNAGVILEEVLSQQAAEKLVKDKKLEAAIVLDKDYVKSGKIKVFRPSGSLFNKTDQLPIGRLLTRALLNTTKVDPDIVKRAAEPTGGGSSIFTLNKRGGFSPNSVGDEISKFAVPYIFTILLTTSIFISASYLLRGIAEEKENRVIEVILSSVSAGDLLRGKLLGLGAVALTQVGIWLLLSALPAALLLPKFVHLSFGLIALVSVIFILGFEMYGAMMAGVGALGTSYRETQQVAGTVSMIAVIPLIVMPVLLEFPNGTLARIFSFVPPTAPIAMVLRVTATDVAPWEIALSLSLMAGFIWLVLGFATKLFRFGLLIYGKRPTFKETWRWLCAA